MSQMFCKWMILICKLQVMEIVVGDSMNEFYMVMEYAEHDLAALMKTFESGVMMTTTTTMMMMMMMMMMMIVTEETKDRFNMAEVKCLLVQLISGLLYLHTHWV